MSDAEPRIGEEGSKNHTDRKIVQTSIRVEEGLLRDFRKATATRDENMNSAISKMMRQRVEEWRRDPVQFAAAPSAPATDSDFDYTSNLHGYYLAWLPTTVIIREVLGRVIYADPDYHQLVGKSSVAGHLPADDWDEESARIMMERHDLVRHKKKPLLSAENAKINDKLTPRLRIRFPIYESGDARGPVRAVGVLGLDLEMVRKAVFSIDPKPGGPRTQQLKEPRRREIVVPPQCPPSLVENFITSLPLLATIKKKDGQVLCVNPAYCAVTRKTKDEVEGRCAFENWPGNPLADQIMYHDLLVRETRATYISVEEIPIKPSGSEKRVNIRFPIFDGAEVVMTGCLGLDYASVRDVLDKWRDDYPYCRPLDIVSSRESKSASRK